MFLDLGFAGCGPIAYTTHAVSLEVVVDSNATLQYLAPSVLFVFVLFTGLWFVAWLLLVFFVIFGQNMIKTERVRRTEYCHEQDRRRQVCFCLCARACVRARGTGASTPQSLSACISAARLLQKHEHHLQTWFPPGAHSLSR